MRTVLPEIKRWQNDGQQVALATVVRTSGSSPRPLGSRMVISSGGSMAGSVSGGCVEGSVFTEAQEVIASGTPRVAEYGITDDEAWAVGLSCGGQLDVLIEPVPALAAEDQEDPQPLAAMFNAAASDQSAVSATVLLTPATTAGLLVGNRLFVGRCAEIGSLGSPAFDDAARPQAERALEDNSSRTITIETDGESASIFLDVTRPDPRLVIVGAVHTAIHLVHFANELGFKTIVVDPRTAFANEERFPHCDELIVEWPERAIGAMNTHEEAYFAFLSHDPKLDDPGLVRALASEARYVGALGSKKTHAKRIASLEELGVPTEQIERIHNPIGLKLGGRRPQEIAAGIAAQLVQARYGRL